MKKTLVECKLEHNTVDCPIHKTMSTLGKKWTLLILKELSCKGIRKRRYNELKKALGRISPNVLSSRLREMETQGLIKRSVFANEIPMRVEYSLTEKGKATKKVITALRDWGLEWSYENSNKAQSKCALCRGFEQ